MTLVRSGNFYISPEISVDIVDRGSIKRVSYSTETQSTTPVTVDYECDDKRTPLFLENFTQLEMTQPSADRWTCSGELYVTNGKLHIKESSELLSKFQVERDENGEIELSFEWDFDGCQIEPEDGLGFRLYEEGTTFQVYFMARKPV